MSKERWDEKLSSFGLFVAPPPTLKWMLMAADRETGSKQYRKFFKPAILLRQQTPLIDSLLG